MRQSLKDSKPRKIHTAFPGGTGKESEHFCHFVLFPLLFTLMLDIGFRVISTLVSSPTIFWEKKAALKFRGLWEALINQMAKAMHLKRSLTLPFSPIVACAVDCSPPCLLTRLSGPTHSWPRNKSRINPFPIGFKWKLVIKSHAAPRGDIGEPTWVYEGSQRRWHPCLHCMMVMCSYHSVKITTI